MSHIILGTGCIRSGLVTLNKHMALSLFVDTVFSLSLSLHRKRSENKQRSRFTSLQIVATHVNFTSCSIGHN